MGRVEPGDLLLLRATKALEILCSVKELPMRWRFVRFWRACVNSRNGVVFAIGSEHAVRQELVALAISLPVALLVGTTTVRRVELVAAVAFVLVIELVNTAIEKLADRVTLDPDLQIKQVKDLGSAAVAVALLIAAAFWLLALAERMSAI